jgi:DNA mismatch repair ATPase MutS
LRLKQQDNDFVEAQATAQTLRHATSIHDILRSHEETKILYPAIPVNPTPAWYSVIDRAQTSTFNENRKPIAPFMDYGTIENFIEACEYPQNEIGQMTRFYGELDAYTSLAQLYLDQQSKTNSFDEKITVSFADFIDDSTESILHIHNFWHPMIPQERVRPSILELGGTHQARDLVITGPNAGGKSVNLKALFANLFLAQTCGLATAESLSFTPFTKLVGRFKGVDDTSSDKSKFMLEAIEMTGLMKQMMDLKPKEHAFVVTDELFTGTEVGPAISLSMELCMQIAKMKNVMYVLATHYKQLTDLSATTGGVFENYKVEVFKDKETQKLMYPYKLTKGIGNTNVAFDIFLEQLEKQGVDDPVLKEIIFKAKKRQESIEQSL